MYIPPQAPLRLNTDDFIFSLLVSRHHLRTRSAAAALTAALLLAGCQAETAPTPVLDRPAQVQRVMFDATTVKREFVGVVRARHETDLGFRIGGKIVTRVVNVGDRVRSGDVIARLDPQDLQLQVGSAEAELAAAISALVQAAADLRRYTTLKERGHAAFADFDRRQAANDEAEGRVERARRALDLARNQHAYADLRANADGVITATPAEPGQVVAVGQPVARLAHRGETEAVVALPETWLAEVRRTTAAVQLWSDRDRRFAATLRELSPQADPATRTFAARFTIIDADDSVALGMTATVILERTRDVPVARLPLAAILNRGTGPSVYVIDDTGALRLRAVSIAEFTSDAALVSAGIHDGERVVTLGVHKLEAGLKVRPVEKTAAR